MTTNFLKLEKAIIDALIDLRAAYAAEDIGQLFFNIEVRGHTMRDELSVEFKLGKSSYEDSSVVCGGRIASTLEEFFHRNGYRQRNTPLCLPAATTSTDEIEF